MPQVACFSDWMMLYGLFLTKLCWVEVVVSRKKLCFVSYSLLKDFLSQQLTFPLHSFLNECSKRCGGLRLTSHLSCSLYHPTQKVWGMTWGVVHNLPLERSTATYCITQHGQSRETTPKQTNTTWVL
jgi:hypothetical protein